MNVNSYQTTGPGERDLCVLRARRLTRDRRHVVVRRAWRFRSPVVPEAAVKKAATYEAQRREDYFNFDLFTSARKGIVCGVISETGLIYIGTIEFGVMKRITIFPFSSW